MPWIVPGWWIVAMAAVMPAILITGMLVLLHVRNRMVIRLLAEKCGEAGVMFVVPPGPGSRMETKKGGAPARRRGVVALTAFELVFVPRWGTATVQVPMEKITGYARDLDHPRVIIIHTDVAAVTYAVQAPEGWQDPAKPQGKTTV